MKNVGYCEKTYITNKGLPRDESPLPCIFRTQITIAFKINIHWKFLSVPFTCRGARLGGRRQLKIEN